MEKQSLLKAIIFRSIISFLTLLAVGFWIEIGSFDAIYFSLTIFLSFIFIIDVCGLGDYDLPNGFGYITKILFYKKEKNNTLKK